MLRFCGFCRDYLGHAHWPVAWRESLWRGIPWDCVESRVVRFENPYAVSLRSAATKRADCVGRAFSPRPGTPGRRAGGGPRKIGRKQRPGSVVQISVFAAARLSTLVAQRPQKLKFEGLTRVCGRNRSGTNSGLPRNTVLRGPGAAPHPNPLPGIPGRGSNFLKAHTPTLVHTPDSGPASAQLQRRSDPCGGRRIQAGPW